MVRSITLCEFSFSKGGSQLTFTDGAPEKVTWVKFLNCYYPDLKPVRHMAEFTGAPSPGNFNHGDIVAFTTKLINNEHCRVVIMVSLDPEITEDVVGCFFPVTAIPWEDVDAEQGALGTVELTINDEKSGKYPVLQLNFTSSPGKKGDHHIVVEQLTQKQVEEVLAAANEWTCRD